VRHWRFWRRHGGGNGRGEAAREHSAALDRLAAARMQRADTREAADRLARLIEQALRGTR
jgi:hypothetical protein